MHRRIREKFAEEFLKLDIEISVSRKSLDWKKENELDFSVLI